MVMKKIIVILIALGALWSCSELLEQEPIGPRTDAAYWKTEADMFDAITGTYQMLTSGSRSLGMHDLFFDNQGDDHWRAGDHSQDEDIETHNTNTDNYKIRNPYTDKYEMISRANGIIINGPKVLELGTISQEKYNTIMGEAYFCRAWAYYRLLVIQGQVPLILEDNVLENNYNVPKVDSPDIIRNQVISDLEKSLTLLPLTNDAGRAHKGAAWALLCKAHLHGAEAYADNGNLSKVISYGSEVIARYPLAADYESIFRTGCEQLPEWLWGMMNDEVWLNIRFMTKHRGPRPWGMYSFQEPLDDLANEFEPGDIRHKVTVIDDGDSVYMGSTFGWQKHTSNLSQTGHSYRKYMQFRDDGWFIHWIPVAFLRVGETYMNVAEAKIRLNGAGAGDTEINLIRARAGLAPISGGDINALMHESRCEEAGENMRYQNLLRWHKAGIINLESWFSATPAVPAKLYPDDIGRKIWKAPKDYYQPLPQLEIDNSDGVLIQNPNWSGGIE
jgi:hypothetical protein